jgi:hypothetical protein
MATWPEPDGSKPPGPSLSADLPVMVVQERGQWARIRCSNGWEAWVDGGRLVPPIGSAPAAPAAPPSGPPSVAPSPASSATDRAVLIPLVGGVAVGVSALLPWIDAVESANAFDVRLAFLADYETGDSGLKLGLLLLALGAGIVAIAVRRLGETWLRITGAAAVLIGVVHLVQLQRLMSALDADLMDAFGFGPLVTIAGGAAAAAGGRWPRSSSS